MEKLEVDLRYLDFESTHDPPTSVKVTLNYDRENKRWVVQIFSRLENIEQWLRANFTPRVESGRRKPNDIICATFFIDNAQLSNVMEDLTAAIDRR